MGRRDAVQTILEVVAECRRLLPGLIVTWEPGWETRGNGTSANYSFGSIHHTASASSAARPFPTQKLLADGRSDLSGPLANVGTPWCTVEAPRLHVVAAHPANHGGASRASGPVPKLSLFNPTSLGNEIDYAGTVPMSAGQLLVGHVWTKAVANVLAGGNVEVVRGHYETSVTGKWDPGYASGKSYDMNDWRRKSAAIAPQGGSVVVKPGSAIEAAYNRVVLPPATWGFFLGAPKGPEVATAGKDGFWQEFANGAIYAHGGAAYVVWGDILRKFWEAGAESVLGYPITDEMSTPDSKGRYNHFSHPDGASIYYHPDAGTHVIKGDIRKKWAALGWEVGFGYPTTDETPTPDGKGAYNHFTRDGSIYWTPAHGAVAVWGVIRAAWIAQGWESGAWGYPVADPVIEGDVISQRFEGGTARFDSVPRVAFQPAA